MLVPIPEQIDFEDYRKVDGVKLPFLIRISNIDPHFSSTRRFTEIRHNIALDDARFRLPAGNRAYLTYETLLNPEPKMSRNNPLLR